MSRTNTAENAKLEVESGQTLFAMAALTNSGDNKKFTSGASLFSDKSGFSPEILPNGLDTGGLVKVGTGNDIVLGEALTCYLAGVKTTVAASGNLTVLRGVTTDICRINSITITSAGAWAVVSGVDNTAFSETRGANGGPPFIPTGSIEIAQVRLTSVTAAPVIAGEIFQAMGQHQEKYDYPLWDYIMEEGAIDFVIALPLIHTGSVPKAVYGKVYEPIFAEVSLSSAFVPPANSFSVSSTQVYGATVGASSKSIGQGSFTAYLKDGVTDAIVKLKDQLLWFRFYPDKFKAPYILAQGKLGIAKVFPADNNISVACTISASKEATDKTS